MIKFIGDGGHAKVIKALIRAISRDWQNDIDPNKLSGRIIAVGDNRHRKTESEKYERYVKHLIHPRAWIACGTTIGKGTVVMAGAIVQPGCKIGKHVILNTGCTVDHDCVIEDFVHIAPGVHLCGGVHVGEGALMGVGSCAVPGAKIEAWSLVKAGTVAK